jgi:hypothetical protein
MVDSDPVHRLARPVEVWSSNGPLLDMKVLRARHGGVLLRAKPRPPANSARALLLIPLRQLPGHSSPNTPQKLAFKRTLLASRMVSDSFGSDESQGSNVNKD